MRLTRRERVKLLLATLTDATAPSRGESDVRGALDSRPPPRPELFDQGSYRDLWRAVDRLKEQGFQKAHRHLCARYLKTPTLMLTRGGIAVPFKIEPRYVERGITLVLERMPRNVYVPPEVSENAGYSAGEAAAASRPRRLAA